MKSVHHRTLAYNKPFEWIETHQFSMGKKSAHSIFHLLKISCIFRFKVAMRETFEGQIGLTLINHDKIEIMRGAKIGPILAIFSFSSNLASRALA